MAEIFTKDCHRVCANTILYQLKPEMMVPNVICAANIVNHFPAVTASPAVTALCVIWEYLYYCLASPSINRTRNFVQELVFVIKIGLPSHDSSIFISTFEYLLLLASLSYATKIARKSPISLPLIEPAQHPQYIRRAKAFFSCTANLLLW